MRAARATAAAAVAVGALILTSCGDQPAPAQDDLGPLYGYLNEIYGEYDPTDPNVGADPATVQAEEAVAACMTEAGFEYVPVVGPVGSVLVNVHELGWGSLAFSEQFGYGYSTEPWGDGGGNLTWMPEPPENDAAERNSAYVATLSPAAQAEYELALQGELNPDGPQDPSQFGCFQRSYDDVAAASGVNQQFTGVQQAMNEMWATYYDDPRLAELEARWAICMADAGYPDLTARIDAENLVVEMVNRFLNSAAASVDPGAGPTMLDAVQASVPTELAALQAQEIAVAVADATCRDDLGYDRTLREIEVEYQRDFIDTHRDELDAWVAAVKAEQG